MQAVKLIVTDIDGTIMPEGSRDLQPRYYELITQLREAGYIVVIASGRQSESIERLFEPVLDQINYIANGGLCIKSPSGRRILQEIPRDWVEELEHDIAQLDEVEGLFCGLEVSYVHQGGTEMVRRLVDEYRVNVSVAGGLGKLPHVPLGKISLFREEGLEELIQHSFLSKWRARLSASMAGDYWLDCMMTGVDKGNALRLLCEELGIAASAVLASGDQMNDVPMLQWAGHSIAVSNARPELQAIADEVQENGDYLAVARAWERLLSME